MSKRKYKMGDPIHDFTTLLQQKVVFITLGAKPIVRNIEFVRSLQIRLVERWLSTEMIRFALKADSEK